jgi:glutamate synthase domain-containing protein 3
VLGRTGRNFAAGMTGGVAYVLDETGEFQRVRCNHSSVDVEAVTDMKDAGLVQRLIARHAEFTGSPRARWVLDHWETMLPKFVKVFPHEYKRVLGVARTAAISVGTPAAAPSAREVPRG